MKRILHASVIAIASAGMLFPSFVQAALTVPAQNLRLGDSNSAVYVLQVFLNSNADTQVAQSGDGAPGHETNYFGSKTLDAVKRFQQKYSAQILAPVGLSVPTGFVGPSTLAEMRVLAQSSASATQSGTQSPAQSLAPANPSGSVSSINYAPTSGVWTQSDLLQAVSATATLPAYLASLPVAQPITPDTIVPPGVNPNSINLDYAIAAIDARGKEEGYDPKQLSALESAIRTYELSTTTNYAQKFFNSVPTKNAEASSNSFLAEVAHTRLAPIASFLGLNNVAHAITASFPFGTPSVIFVMPCTCSEPMLDVFMTPLPPTFAAELSYMPGTQLFLNYEVSHPAQAVLGEYEPTQSCYFYIGYGCITLPTWGQITPEVGSSV